MSAAYSLPLIPPLESGDRLTREEFERRYEAMPELKKAELIEGVVYVGSPVRAREHGNPHLRIATWVGLYEGSVPGLVGADNSSVRLDFANEPQPDVLLFIPTSLGGQAEVDPDGYITGAPELVVEVAATSASHDAGAKKEAYRRSGVREYLIWRVLDREVEWYGLRSGEYQPLQSGPDGVLRSEVFPGLWLDVEALLQGDMPRVTRVLMEGMATPEHRAFAARLAG